MAPCKSLQALVIFRLCAAFTIHSQFADSVQLIFMCFLSEESCIALFCGSCIPVGGGCTLNSSQHLYMCFALQGLGAQVLSRKTHCWGVDPVLFPGSSPSPSSLFYLSNAEMGPRSMWVTVHLCEMRNQHALKFVGQLFHIALYHTALSVLL